MQYILGREKCYIIILGVGEKENLGVNIETGWGIDIMIGSISGAQDHNSLGARRENQARLNWF